MEAYLVTFTKQAIKDMELLKGDPLAEKAKELLAILEVNPFQKPPPYERLRGQLEGMYSRRLNRQHRLVYEVRSSEDPRYKGVVNIVRLRTHYRGLPSVIMM